MSDTGLGDLFYISGVDLSGDVSNITASGGPTTTDITNITQSATARLPTSLSGLLDFVTYFDRTSAHPVLAALPTSDVIGTYVHGSGATQPAAGLIGRQPDYKATRGSDGSLTFGVQLQSDGAPIEWGHGYVGGSSRTDSSATTGTSVDDGSSTSVGFTAYLHVFGFAGTSATIAFEHSADNGVTDPWVSLVVFNTTTTAPSSQRAATSPSLTVKRYVRVRTSGVFTNLIFYAMGLRFSLAATGVAVAVDVQVFTSSGTWTKAAGVSAVLATAIGGGGGGGRGVGSATFALSGGGGGAGGGYATAFYPASALPASLPVLVGAGGLGGSAVNGTAGGIGGQTKFGTTTQFLLANGGGGGAGGTNNASLGGTSALAEQSSDAGAGGVQGGAGVTPASGLSQRQFCGSSGASGGGTSIGPATAYAGGTGQGNLNTSASIALGGNATGGAGGVGGSAPTNSPLPGNGGGGGGGNIGAPAGAGGAGGLYGGGGAGGGSADSSANRGDGGPGAQGILVVISW